MTRRLIRGTVLLAGAIAVTLALLSSPARAAAAPEVTVVAPRTVIGPAGDVVVRVTLANPTTTSMRVLEWNTPADLLAEPLFDVMRDGAPVEYLGPLVKRGAPTAADYLLLEPGASRSFDVNLGERYSFAADGTYEIRYRTAAADLLAVGRAKLAGGLVSNEVGLIVVGRPDPAPAPTVGASSATNPGCSAGQETELAAALTAADAYADAAVQYFADNRSGARYQTWFGAYNATRWQSARTHFQAIAAVTGGSSVQFTCGDPLCGSASTFAFVYPAAPYMTYVCGGFWAAALTGTDSRAGTIIHEISHFTVVASTDDHVYGQEGAMALAVSNPARAVDNADNHEYFAENTPDRMVPALTATAVAHDLGQQAIGSSSAQYAFTVTTSGDADVVFGTVSTSGDFSLSATTCSGATLPPATTLAPAGTCTIDAAFAPTASGSRTGAVALASNAVSGATSLALSGTGIVVDVPVETAPVVPVTAAAPAPISAPVAARMTVRSQASTRLAIAVGSAATERWTFRIRVPS